MEEISKFVKVAQLLLVLGVQLSEGPQAESSFFQTPCRGCMDWTVRIGRHTFFKQALDLTGKQLAAKDGTTVRHISSKVL